jgi:hypothetical protein
MTAYRAEHQAILDNMARLRELRLAGENQTPQPRTRRGGETSF